MLKNVKQNIFSLFKKLRLKLETENLKKVENSIVVKKRFYTDLVNNNLFLKIKLQKRKEVKRDLEREIESYKILKKKFPEKLRFFPKLISEGKHKNLYWMLEKAERGKLGGIMGEDFGMKKSFLLKISPSYLASLIFLYQNLKPKFPLYKQGGWWYWQDFNGYRVKFLNEFINSKFNQNLLKTEDIFLAQKILSENKKYLDQSTRYLSHGDLYPNNFILNEEGKLIILDWGLANFNNSAFDVAFVYLLSHRLPTWQRNFLNAYLLNIKEKDKFKKLFNLALISLTVRFAAHCYFNLRTKKEVSSIFKKHLKIFKKAIAELKL
jgi:serine/threonine protein kinase